ncbi:MAG: hypothetical protein Q9M92_12865 [Enterobacterales bacterium]|nr:hypothetical protein [Enterobacterales bacterium]
MKCLKTLVLVSFVSLLAACAVSVTAHEEEGDISRVFGGIDIHKGAKVGDLSSVNGGVDIGSNAVVGDVSTVNGGIDIGSQVQIKSAETVNGGIEARQDLAVKGDLSTVNGGIELSSDSLIGGSIETVNGDIDLSGVTISRNIETVNGDVSLLNSTQLKGDLIISKNSGWFSSVTKNKIVITIDENSSVDGTIHLYQKVILKIAKNAKVNEIEYHYERE